MKGTAIGAVACSAKDFLATVPQVTNWILISNIKRFLVLGIIDWKFLKLVWTKFTLGCKDKSKYFWRPAQLYTVWIYSIKRLVDGDTNSLYLTEQSKISDPIANIIHKICSHTSIISIQRNAISKNFSFKHFKEDDEDVFTGIPIRSLKENADYVQN